MQALRQHLNSLSVTDQHAFARKCGTTLNYLRKAISVRQKIGESLVINIERETRGAITCEQLRPDVDWAVIRGKRRKAS